MLRCSWSANADPVGSGFVASFPRPGGDVTGFTNLEPTMAGKWLELLKEIAPRVNQVAILFNPATATYFEYFLNPFKAVAASFAVEAIAAPVRDRSELDSAVAAQARAPNGGLIVMPDPFTVAHRAEITSLAARYRLPAVYHLRVFAELGGLLSYGHDPLDNYRRAAAYADRILKGAKPGELPVQAPVKFELVINMKTAKALGLDVPVQLQQRADEVIEHSPRQSTLWMRADCYMGQTKCPSAAPAIWPCHAQDCASGAGDSSLYICSICKNVPLAPAEPQRSRSRASSNWSSTWSLLARHGVEWRPDFYCPRGI